MGPEYPCTESVSLVLGLCSSSLLHPNSYALSFVFFILTLLLFSFLNNGALKDNDEYLFYAM